MTFATGYEHDIFVSYAHLDNVPDEGVAQGWVTTFFQNLEKRLKQKLGSGEVSLWMDHRELVNHAPLTPQIMESLQQTATFLVIASPGYLASEWCNREREEFLRLMKQRTDSGSRIFLVELDKVEPSEFPHEFSDLIGYRFWVPEKTTGIPRTLGTPVPDPSDHEYYTQLNRICVELAVELKRIKSEYTPAPSPPGESIQRQPSQITIYLAEVTDDLDSRREEVRDYLKQANFGVLPETWQRYDDIEAFNQAIDRDLMQCAIFAQLLSGVAGKKPFGQSHGYPRLQYDRAIKCGKPILQWRDPSLEISKLIDKDQRDLLEGATVQAQGIEEFKRAVIEAVTPKTPAPAPQTLGKFVFVSADPIDRARAEELVSKCWHNNVGYVMPPMVSDPAIVRQYLEVSLLNCDAALVVYCGTDPASVLGQLMQCRKILTQREPPLPALAIYDGPPPPDEKAALNLMFPNLRHLNCRLDQQDLKEFLEKL